MEAVRSKQEGVPFFEASDKGFACGFGLFNFLLMDASRNIYAAINAQERIIDKEDLQIVTRELTNIKKINDIKTPLYGIAKDRNVILISLESFSTGFVDLKAGETEISPTINKLKKQGLYWENVMSSITRGGSSDAEFSILTGLMADRRKATIQASGPGM
jgi:phosphoglycerol transferase MdoB-like AlkP superfamily enzyme